MVSSPLTHAAACPSTSPTDTALALRSKPCTPWASNGWSSARRLPLVQTHGRYGSGPRVSRTCPSSLIACAPLLSAGLPSVVTPKLTADSSGGRSTGSWVGPAGVSESVHAARARARPPATAVTILARMELPPGEDGEDDGDSIGRSETTVPNCHRAPAAAFAPGQGARNLSH